MTFRLILAAVIAFGLSGCAHTWAADLDLPAFDHLRSRATDSVDITIGALPIRFAGWVMDDNDPESAAIKGLLKGVRKVCVRHYEFAEDHVYSRSDLDSVRAQLSGKGWQPLVRVRDRKKDEDVDIFVAVEQEKINGLAIVASEPREFTIVNVVGTLDLEQVDAFRQQFESGHPL